jgi:GNAT superfamily N-acetyltransferase
MSVPQTKKVPQPDLVAVRLAEMGDAAAISTVLMDSFGQYREHYTPEAFAIVTPPPAEVEGRFTEGPQWVAEVGGEIVGTVGVTHEPEGLYIRSLGVIPGAQGRGIAYKLMAAIDGHARERGFDRIFLYTTYFVPAAPRLYEKCGFKWVRDTAAEEWYGTAGLEMEKFIGSETAATE